MNKAEIEYMVTQIDLHISDVKRLINDIKKILEDDPKKNTPIVSNLTFHDLKDLK